MQLRFIGLVAIGGLIAAHPVRAVETRPACIMLNDVQIVGGVEKVVQKQLCRSAGSARYDLVQDSAYGAAVTQSAFDRASDPELRALRGAIEAVRGQVQSSQSANEAMRADLSRAQQEFVDKLSAKDRAYAEAIGQFRDAVVDIASTPEGQAALVQYNAGHEAEALAVLDRVSAANDAARQKLAAIESAAEKRRIAGLALDARVKGKVDTTNVIARFEEVTKLDPDVFNDWIELADLYVLAGRLVDADHAEQTALTKVRDDHQRMVYFASYAGLFNLRGQPEQAEHAWIAAYKLSRDEYYSDKTDLRKARNFIRSTNGLADIYIVSEKYQRADEILIEAMKLSRNLVNKNPIDLDNMRDLSGVNSRLGYIHLSQKKAEAARSEFLDSLKIDREILEHDPKNSRSQDDLSHDLLSYAQFLENEGDHDGAARLYREGLEISRRLAKADPSNAERQRDVAITLFALAEIHPTKASWKEVIDQFEMMKIRGLFAPSDRAMLDEAQAKAVAAPRPKLDSPAPAG